MKLITVVAIAVVALAGCGRGMNALKQYDTNVVLKISVMKSGDILADGEKTTLEALDSLVATNAAKKGIVWYFREAPEDQNPPPQAEQVIQLVIKHKRPIRLCKKADFSDAAD